MEDFERHDIHQNSIELNSSAIVIRVGHFFVQQIIIDLAFHIDIVILE